MKWTRIEIRTTTGAVDFISSLFDDLGLEGMQIEDGEPPSEADRAAMFLSPLDELEPDLPPWDGRTAVVSTCVEPERATQALKRQLAEGLSGIARFVSVGEGTIVFREVDDADWIDNWKEFFKPFQAAKGIWIKPTWEKLEGCGPDELVVELDPGTAFGTGSHETTRLCIEALRKYLKKGQSVLDVGCGSGILSVIALLSGAGRAVGTDIDPAAVAASHENMEGNRIARDRYQFFLGDLLKDTALQDRLSRQRFDLVAANILADVIIPLCHVAGDYLKPGGVFLTSGIYRDKEEAVRRALEENGFLILERNAMGDWTGFAARKQ